MKTVNPSQSKSLIITYTTLAVVFAGLMTRFQFPGFPDVALALFMALSMSCSYTACLVIGIILGLIAEGLSPELIWITPLLYVLLASSSSYASQQMNLRRWPLLSYFTLWALVFKLLPPLIHNQSVSWPDVIAGTLLTGLLAFFAHLPWAKHG